MIEVKVSGKWARHLFGCTVDYIKTTCHGRCCQGTGRILVSLTPEEETTQTLLGKTVEGGRLQADDRGLCPWKCDDGLCRLHGTRDKPLGCVASPFTINAGGTLIVRHRYSLMKCHGHGLPAYVTFRASLDRIFGFPEANRICAALDMGDADVQARMEPAIYHALLANDRSKRSKT